MNKFCSIQFYGNIIVFFHKIVNRKNDEIKLNLEKKFVI